MTNVKPFSFTSHTFLVRLSLQQTKHILSQIIIFSPSLHLFNNSKVEGEIIVVHTPESGGQNLFVCVWSDERTDGWLGSKS